jgi:hypothetical protein
VTNEASSRGSALEDVDDDAEGVVQKQTAAASEAAPYWLFGGLRRSFTGSLRE